MKGIAEISSFLDHEVGTGACTPGMHAPSDPRVAEETAVSRVGASPKLPWHRARSRNRWLAAHLVKLARIGDHGAGRAMGELRLPGFL